MREGKPHGHGISTTRRFRYEGEFRDGKRHGHGTLISIQSGRRNEGEWHNGKRHGYSIWSGGDRPTKTCEYRNGDQISCQEN